MSQEFNPTNPEQPRRIDAEDVKRALVDIFERGTGSKSGAQALKDQSAYEFPTDLREFDAAEFIRDDRSAQVEVQDRIQAEFDTGEFKEVPATKHSLEKTEQDIHDTNVLLNGNITADQMIQAIDQAEEH